VSQIGVPDLEFENRSLSMCMVDLSQYVGDGGIFPRTRAGMVRSRSGLFEE
jgi:hypothetical protein